MKRLGILALLILVAFSLCACARKPAQSAANHQKITAEQAKAAAESYLHEQYPDTGIAPFTLTDVTPVGVFAKTGFQLFSDANDQGAATFLVRNGKAVHDIIGFGGFGLASLETADFDARGGQLVYTYSWGSGLHRSILEVCDGEWGAYSVYADFSGKNLMIKKESKDVFGIYEARYDESGKNPKKGERLGTLRGERVKNGGFRLVAKTKDGEQTVLVNAVSREVLVRVGRIANPQDPKVLLSSNTSDYIESGRADYDAVIEMGEAALPALLEEVVFKQDKGLTGAIMQKMIQDITAKAGTGDLDKAALYKRYVGARK